MGQMGLIVERHKYLKSTNTIKNLKNSFIDIIIKSNSLKLIEAIKDKNLIK